MFIHIPIEIEIAKGGLTYRMELEQLPDAERDGFHKQFVTNLVATCFAVSGYLPELTTIRNGSALCTQTAWPNSGPRPLLGAMLDAMLKKLPTGIAVGCPTILENRLTFDLVIDVVTCLNQNQLVPMARA